MLGAILGDIVGSIYEFNNIHTKDFPFIKDECTFTDDTVMTVAVAKALLTTIKNNLNEEDTKLELIKDMRLLGNKYPGRGYGGMFYHWLHTSNPTPYNSFGNGSAMRVSSVGWLFNSLEEVEYYASLTAEVTHNHIEGIKGAKATAAAIYLSRINKSKEEIKEYISKTYGYNLNESVDEIRDYYCFNETCQKTVPQAIMCFLEGNNYEDVVRNAISIGGDSDTLACIAGSIAEAYYDMPKEYKEIALSKLDDYLRAIYKGFIMEVNKYE